MKRALLCLLGVCQLLLLQAQKDCRQVFYQEQLLQGNPALGNEYAKIEAFTRGLSYHIQSATIPSNSNALPAIITIPVVIHVLWNQPSENISDNQIAAQLEVLNNDFRLLNADRNQIPDYFSSLAADGGFRFVLANTDPAGASSTGILRKQTAIQAFGISDGVKSGAAGGDDPWDANSYLNIWVCNLEQGILGYSSVPGGPKDRDGVVINASVFGTLQKPGAFNKGRTAVHEIGHWLNLRHIWGDAMCGDDGVDDTPTQQAPTRGCPQGIQRSCGNSANGNMYMNYMDFTNDACMLMFTKGQCSRMRTLFVEGGARHALLRSQGLSGRGLPTAAIQETDPYAAAAMQLYPNPAADQIQIRLLQKPNFSGTHISIYNQVGQLVKKVDFMTALQNIDIRSLRPGFYILKIEGSAGTHSSKFLKQ